MIDITKHIHELLYRHDCVILPGFGGFILHDRNAGYDASSGMFLPPARELSFNGLLTSDDGLLVSTVAEREGIVYDKGKTIVEEFILSLRKSMEKGEAAVIEGVGKFVMSEEKKWVFTPSREINFLESAFGFRPVAAEPVPTARGRAHERPMRARADRKPAAPPRPVPAAVKWTLSAGVPVILFLLWGILFPQSFQRQYTSYSGLLSDLLAVTLMQPADPLPSAAAAETGAGRATPMPSFPVLLPLESSAISLPPSPSAEIAPRMVHNVQTVTPPGTYHVIGGVFRSEENANRYIEALGELGYPAALAGTNRQGHHRVSYDSFQTWKAAAAFLKEIQRKENPSAWILKY